MHETRRRRNRDAGNTGAPRRAARYRGGIDTRASQALFVLLPAGRSVDDLLAALPDAQRAAVEALARRRYPPADDARHLASLVRAGRDRLATHWRRGALLAVGGGALLGAVVNGVLAGAFGMLGGLLEIAVPLGFCLGAFLGAFTAAMTGTERPREQLLALWPHVRRGSVLLQCSGADRQALAVLAAHCAQQQLPYVQVDA